MGWRRILFIGLMIIVIAGVVLVLVTPGTKRNELVGMGDSYASGEGLPPFLTPMNGASDSCHQSANSAYPVIAAHALGLAPVMKACSGATTASLLGTSDTPGQDTSLTNAKYITITIGGNDVNALGAILNPPDQTQLQQQLADLQTTLASAYSSVALNAPFTDIFVTGYPNFIPEIVPAGCFLDPAAAVVLRSELSQLNSVVQTAAASAHVHYVDFGNTFKGHELCSASPWVNGIDLANTSASLHPTADGQAAMADQVVATIRATKSSN